MQVGKDEYIHVKAPKWFWILTLSLLMLCVIFLSITWVTINQFHNEETDTLSWEARGTSAIAIIAGTVSVLVGAAVFITGLAVFPKEIRSKDDPAFRRIWPPWDD